MEGEYLAPDSSTSRHGAQHVMPVIRKWTHKAQERLLRSALFVVHSHGSGSMRITQSFQATLSLVLRCSDVIRRVMSPGRFEVKLGRS
jgi:hypothetical protein